MAAKRKTVKKRNKPKNKGGRPTKYIAAYCGQVYKLCLLGATDAEIADFFGVVESTVNLWKLNYKRFSESIKKGKEKADYTIAESLHERAKGFKVKRQAAFKLKKYNAASGKMEECIQVVNMVEQVPPDTPAAIFWLKNRRPRQWRDKQEVEHAGEIVTRTVGPIPIVITTMEQQAKLDEHIKKDTDKSDNA